ncbi:MAG: magnesium-dependent phosphatase-1 [Candidatus Brockarchaeota archaeon]|nr:magnesium-dependent phosphatase-1 [Candidatus Brockarchaeota archaeon]
MIDRPSSLAAVKIDETVKLLVLDVDGTLWVNSFDPGRHPPFRRIDANEIVTGDGEVIRLSPGLLELLNQAGEKGVVCSLASIGDPDVVLGILEQFKLPTKFVHPQLGWNGKDAMIEEILRKLELEEGMKISDAEIVFVDDDEKELAKVEARFPGAKLVKAP